VIRRRVLLLALPVAACGSPAPPPPPAPPEVNLTIKGGADQNPSPSGQPTPVTVRVLQLTNTGKFDTADPLALTTSPQAVLGDSLLASQDVIVSPGETLSLKITPRPGAQVLGIAVLFRNIDQAQWRVSVPIAPHGPTTLTLTITKLGAKLALA
jgi:type VI secretion system protein VasD